MWFGTETENCTGLKMSGGAEAVQKRCSFAALRRSGTKTGPFPVRYRGGGTRFPEDRGGVEATRRVKLNGAEMKIGTKIVQKRSEMFGPVGFPKGKGRLRFRSSDSEPKSVQNRSGFEGGRFFDL